MLLRMEEVGAEPRSANKRRSRKGSTFERSSHPALVTDGAICGVSTELGADKGEQGRPQQVET